MATNIPIITAVVSVLLLINFVMEPALATRVIEVTKEIDVRKDLFAKQMADLASYQEIFPAFVKEVKVDSTSGNAKFVVEAQGRQEADVKSYVRHDGTFIVEILSGDLKGSKIITKLNERVGFDGTPNGATTVSSTLILETSWVVSMALAIVDDKTISQAVGDGFYELGQYVKNQKPKESLIEANYEMPKLDEENLMPNVSDAELQQEVKKFKTNKTPSGKPSSAFTNADVRKQNHFVINLTA